MSEVQEEDLRRLALVVEADTVAEAAIEVGVGVEREGEGEGEGNELDRMDNMGNIGELGLIENEQDEQDIDQEAQQPQRQQARRNVDPEAETELELESGLGNVDVRVDQEQGGTGDDNDNPNLNPTTQTQSILNLDSINHNNDSTDLNHDDLNLDSTTANDNNDANVNALITLSSLASLGSLPPVPNLAPTSNLGVGGEMPTTTPEASGSGPRTGMAMSPGMNILLGLRAQGLQDSYLTYQNQDQTQGQTQDQDQSENDGYLPGMSEQGRRSRSIVGTIAGAGTGSITGAAASVSKSNGDGLAHGSATKRGRKRKAVTINEADTGAGVQEEGIAGAGASGMGSGGDEADGTDEQGQDQDQDQDQGGGRDGKRSKRAEQNRKAQQAFRKRREEKMKELEEKAREMERLHSAIDGGLRRVREVELENYELKMENQFLRSVVHSLSRLATGAGRSVLDAQGEFVLEDNVRDDGVGTTSQTMESDAPGGSKESGSHRQSDEARIELALTELRERSRIMTQAVDAQRRQRTPEQQQQQQAPQPQIQPDLMQIDDHVPTPQQQPAASQALFLDPTQRNRPLSRSTILVSATPRNGIGCRGKVPWQTPSLGQFHHRVITGPETGDRSDLNTVIMSNGEWKRSTASDWEDVRSVVVSRNQAARNISDPAIVVNSITSALERIPWNSAKIFLIGGAWLFEEALTSDLVDRIIITRILDPAYDDCDAFLPDFHSIRELDPALWRRASHAELCGHVGFQVEPGVVEEDGVRHEHEMWIKV